MRTHKWLCAYSIIGTGVVYVPYVLSSTPADISIYEFRKAWCESKPFVVVPTKNVSRARLNSSYILTLLKVEVSGSCIIIFLDVIVRISLPLESGSAVEDDVL